MGPGLGSPAVGGIPREGVAPHTLGEDTWDGEGAGLSRYRDRAGSELPLLQAAFPAQTHPSDPSQEQRREHSGRLAGSRESHRDSSGKLPTAGCQCQPHPASPGPAAAAAGSRRHVPLPQDRHRTHHCIAFCFPNQGHSVQPQYLSKLAKQPGWKLA